MNFGQLTPSSVLLTVFLLTLAPFVAVMVTSFTKIVVVLGLIRNALGLQQTPPNVVINGLAIILSFYIMYPVGTEIQARTDAAQTSVRAGDDAGKFLVYAKAAQEPLRHFLIRNADRHERAFFLMTARKALPPEHAAKVTDEDFVIIVPAFVVSELNAAFQIGFLLFLPFLVIDLVVSNLLMALGMMMMSPTTVSLPFKILLFVLVDGWAKLAHGLVLSYR